MRGIEGSLTVTLDADIGDVPTAVGTARLENAGAAHIQNWYRTLQNKRLRDGKCEDLVAKSLVNIYEAMMSEAYTYWFMTTDEVPKSLKAMGAYGHYECDSWAMFL